LIDGRREGYWVAFDTNYTIKYDGQYKNDKPNGKRVVFYDGTILIEAEECNGIPNGKYRSYHKYPTVAVEGYESMGKKTGVWKIYSKKGVLNKIVLFDDDTIKKIIMDKGDVDY
jgi:antitoxin component YwqK of YwqJK toxin-antitoxin module